MTALSPQQMRELANQTELISDDLDQLADRVAIRNAVAALRTAADQLEAVTPPIEAPQYSKLLRERERLRAVIENAPHEELCPSQRHAYPKPCTCWKANAL